MNDDLKAKRSRKQSSRRGHEVSATPPDIGRIIAARRKSSGLSLDGLASLSGVSKSMLSKIERNQTNPTLGTVWRLASTFGVGIEQLIGQADRGVLHHKRSYEIPTLTSADGGCTIRILSSLSLAEIIEWYDISAEPHSTLDSAPHSPGAVEHLMMIEGKFTVESAGRSLEVATNETASYPADVPHALRNTQARRARALVIVTYRNAR